MTWQLRSRDAAQVDGPIQFGLPLPRGAFFPGGTVPSVGGAERTDADVQAIASWEDGSIALARVVLRSWPGSPGQVLPVTLMTGSPVEQIFDPSTKAMLNAYTMSATIIDGGGVTWIASVPTAQSWQVLRALVYAQGQGEVRRTFEFYIPFRAVQDHPQLRARVRFTAFSAHPGALCEVSVENTLVDTGRPTSDLNIAFATIIVGSTTVAMRGPHLLEHGTLWRCEGWVGAKGPDVVLIPDVAELATMGLCPPLDVTNPCDDATALALKNTLLGEPQRGRGPAIDERLCGAAGSTFPLYKAQQSGGDRADIGWVPLWTAALINGASDHARDLQSWADCNGSGAFSVHYRGGDAWPMGLKYDHPFWKQSAYPSKKNTTANIAHHVTTGLWSWLLTGRERYFEELRSWACLSARDNYPNDGTLQNPGDRREAWALRSIVTCSRYAPDTDNVRDYMRNVLVRSAGEWQAQLAVIDSTLPLGAYTQQTWKPSGRDQSPFTYVGSPWMAAWFTAMCLATDVLMADGEHFMPIARHGWRWLLQYLATPGGPFNFDVDMLGDYSVPTVFYTPSIVATKWTPVLNSEQPIAEPGSLAYACRLTAATEKPALGPADLPEDANPLHQAAKLGDVSAPYGGSKFHEYGPGRCGTHLLGQRFGLERASEVVTILAPLIAARAEETHFPKYARSVPTP
jgi:hypothetical protein